MISLETFKLESSNFAHR